MLKIILTTHGLWCLLKFSMRRMQCYTWRWPLGQLSSVGVFIHSNCYVFKWNGPLLIKCHLPTFISGGWSINVLSTSVSEECNQVWFIWSWSNYWRLDEIVRVGNRVFFPCLVILTDFNGRVLVLISFDCNVCVCVCVCCFIWFVYYIHNHVWGIHTCVCVCVCVCMCTCACMYLWHT